MTEVPLSLGTAPCPVEGVASSEVEGEVVLWHAGRTFRLNRTAVMIWSMLDGRNRIDGIVDSLLEFVSVDRPTVVRNVLEFLGQLERQGLLHVPGREPVLVAPLVPADGPVVGPGPRPGPSPTPLGDVRWDHRTGRFDALEHSFGVRSSDPIVIEYLGGVLGALSTDGAPARWYSVLEVPGRERPFMLFLDEADLADVPTREAAIRYILWHVNAQTVRVSSRFAIVHAAAAAKNGVTIVMPGRMNAGKTTLAAGLLRAGFEYFTDELAGLDLDNMTVQPFPRPLNVGQGSWSVLPQLRPKSSIAGAISPAIWHVNPLSVEGARIGTPARPDCVIVPAYEPAGQTRLTPIHRAEALEILVDQLMNAAAHHARAFHSLGDLVQTATCLRLTYSTLDVAVGLVEHVVRSLRGGEAPTIDAHAP